VFDGRAPPYSTAHSPNPLNHYGATKLAGEQAVWSATRLAAVLRIPLLYGPCGTQRRLIVFLFVCFIFFFLLCAACIR
jgi:dTDP-4-dehydrorhamnose reductase